MALVKPSENGDESLKNPRAQSQEMKFSHAADLDKAGGFEFPNVVRERGRADG